jgi:[acyl-carrier-protein] S-malonyltransferase
MGKDLYEKYPKARSLFEEADKILGYSLTQVMFEGSEEQLKETKVTQPAIFVHSLAMVTLLGEDFHPGAVAGHSLGEFSALVAAGALSYADGLQLVYQRARAMQKACELVPSTMAAIIGLDDKIIEEVCEAIDDIVVPANYNCPGQVVISGTETGIFKAMEELQKRGAKRTVKLQVGGAFHSPLMEPAREELAGAIEKTAFARPVCPVYQNVTALPVTDPEEIRKNLVAQLTSPVRWTQSVQKMIADGCDTFIEAGPGKVLQGLIRKIDRSVTVDSVKTEE